ncbi:hypothetical protein Sjap_017898 [Stephania japonica]|uniref:TOD1/MUCI70 glycosyltransferase-like domain-containing protein n=1 Tax=Stephania japonica TaxID=461633 RepID=A0AAP0NK08_9MAGN
MAQFRQSSCSSTASEHVSIGIRMPHKQGFRNRRYARSEKNAWKISFTGVVVILVLVLIVTAFAYHFVSADKESDASNGQDNDLNDDSDFLANVTRTKHSTVLKFGRGSGKHGRDSRYWDKDDRRRDDEYSESASELENADDHNEASVDKIHVKERTKSREPPHKPSAELQGKLVTDAKSIGLYNEAGRDELKQYEAEYEASLKNVERLEKEKGGEHDKVFDADLESQAFDDEYDDGIDFLDPHDAQTDDTSRSDDEDVSGVVQGQENSTEKSVASHVAQNGDLNTDEYSDEAATNTSGENSSHGANVKLDSIHNGRSAKGSSSEKKSDTRKKSKHHKLSGSSCEIKFLNSTAQLIEPLESRKFSRFSLQYTEVEQRPSGEEKWEPRFAGHQTLLEREESFYARDQKINCGFVRGPEGSPSTGFDLAEDDIKFMSSCHIAVSSCIFGSSDNLRTPTGKSVTRLSRKNVCFVMFMDENTLQMLSSEGQKLDRMGFIGLWKVVVVKNLPFTDMRRVGKIPKFLTHRLFPSARYSIWLDSKLRLQKDPLLILEYFLWRKGYEYAISNHYDRHCLWEEVAQNKKLNKFNHTIIDQQFSFYQVDGMKRFNSLDPNKLLPSNVPEGSFIVRAHTPMSNLFSCLWFNEVDRFTPRDQLSFAYTYHKLRRMNPDKPFHLNMFKDCERRSIAKLYHHRSEGRRSLPLQATG